MSIQDMEDLKQYYLDEMQSIREYYSLNEIVSQIPPSIAITPVLLTLEPEDSLIMGNEELSTILEKESDEVIKSSVEDLVPIPRESGDTFGSDSECDLPSCNVFPPINVFKETSVTFSNPLFDSNDDFTSSDDYIPSFINLLKKKQVWNFVVSLTWETISKIEHAFEDKQYQPEGILELFHKLHDDVQNIHEELAGHECDLLLCDDSPKSILTFSNPLFDIDDDFTSSDDESFSGEEVPMENFKIFSNPLFDLDEEIISTKVDQINDEVLDSIDSIPPGIDLFNVEFDLLESLLNRDISIDSSPKIDSLLDEFADELTLLKLITSRIDNAKFDPEGDISLDSDSLMEEIGLFLTPDDSMPSGIENDDYDSEGDIIFLEELLSNDSPSLPEIESFHFDVLIDSDLDVSSPSGDRNKIYDPGICIEVESTRFLVTHSPVIDTLLPFSSENEDKDCLDFEASRARGFVLRSLELHILSFIFRI
ncbi:hypothetical protein Tco_0378436 [Tanacetum coccineum]